jgi:hypothetical protein
MILKVYGQQVVESKSILTIGDMERIMSERKVLYDTG